ncbi:DUF2333 family protein [Thermochromatium tepidum]|uniref:DUF2333 family protein n=1 Tax=Thermochromatium tepidum ATCC 43061 TaxID=316276 RepID=A0A6I6E075_THETI|nr:DUF2333 family protein [Thermochromatium tepidum]QGU32335.1 DUF2333 family protein [Thermochromatium tepidum ATCC 43061]
MDVKTSLKNLDLAKQLTNPFGQLMKLYHPRVWREKGLMWTGGLFIVTYLVVVLVLGMIWSRSPNTFDVRANALAMVEGDETRLVTGSYTTATAIRIAKTLLDKPGGYLSNDRTPPGVYLDNIPNWEFGALTELRDLANALRNELSRAQSQSLEDRDLQIAQPQFNYNSDSWILPSTESEYRKGIEALERYMHRLSRREAQFFARSDNLRAYLQVVEKRLGNLAQRLSYAVGQDDLDTDLAGDPGARRANGTSDQMHRRTPWLQIDDVFFEARGYTWALIHTLQAMALDFENVLKTRNAQVSLEQIIRKLQSTQDPIWSPLILNGTGFGLMANHSLVMASYISRANAAIIDLRRLLEQG